MTTKMTDDFVGVGPLGFMLSKQDWFARHKTGTPGAPPLPGQP